MSAKSWLNVTDLEYERPRKRHVRRPIESAETRKIVILIVVFLASFVLRLWLLDKRWINPDEGAHLMDAVFVLDGKVPIRDFGSRQPFYTYVIAAAFSLFGPTLEVGRALMLVCSMLTGIFVFLIARALFDSKVAVLAAAIYWLLPLEVFNSPIVKTQPMVTLLTSASFYAVLRYGCAERLRWLITSGALAALAFYVRQSALIVPAVVAVLIPVQAGWHWSAAAKGYITFAVGYVCVVAVMMFYFATEVRLVEALWSSGLNPLEFLIRRLGRSVWPVESVPDAELVAASSWDLYYTYVRDSTVMHAFLVAGAGLGAVVAGRSMVVARSSKERRRTSIAYAFLLLWVTFLLGAYGYYFAARGFFVDYAREFLPPLSILFAAGLIGALPDLKREWMSETLIIGITAVGIAIFMLQPHYEHLYSMGQYAAVGVALTAICYVACCSMPSLRRLVLLATLAMLFIVVVVSRHPPLDDFLSGRVPSVLMIIAFFSIVAVGVAGTTSDWVSHYLRFVGVSVVAGSLIVGVSYSSLLLSVRYDSLWSPHAVRAAGKYLRENTVSGDEVLSGAVIWELEASLRPYQGISHPLAFENRISRQKLDRIEAGFVVNPPKIIVLDGYTELTYMRWVQDFSDILGTRYELKATVGPARDPVMIYQRREAVGAPSAPPPG